MNKAKIRTVELRPPQDMSLLRSEQDMNLLRVGHRPKPRLSMVETTKKLERELKVLRDVIIASTFETKEFERMLRIVQVPPTPPCKPPRKTI